MSTPRRDWPRSSGTPITRIFLGVMLVVLMLVVIGSDLSVNSRMPYSPLRPLRAPVREVIYDSFQPIFQDPDVEINEEAHSLVRQAKI